MAELEIDNEDGHDIKKWRRNVMKRKSNLSENELQTDNNKSRKQINHKVRKSKRTPKNNMVVYIYI